MSEKPLGTDLRVPEASRRYYVLNASPGETFDSIANLVKYVLQVPAVFVALFDGERTWLPSRVDPRLTAMLAGDKTLPRATGANPAFNPPPAARLGGGANADGALGLVYCFGAPLTMPDGFNVGTLYALDEKSRTFSAEQVSVVEDVAKLIVKQLELSLVATTDNLTGALLRRVFFHRVANEMERARRYQSALSFLSFDFDHFKEINDRHGHPIGDLVLKRVAEVVQRGIRSVDLFARVGGEEFILALPETDRDAVLNVASRLGEEISGVVVHHRDTRLRVTASFGATSFGPEDKTILDILRRVDFALYQAKADGRNCARFCDSTTSTTPFYLRSEDLCGPVTPCSPVDPAPRKPD